MHSEVNCAWLNIGNPEYNGIGRKWDKSSGISRCLWMLASKGSPPNKWVHVPVRLISLIFRPLRHCTYAASPDDTRAAVYSRCDGRPNCTFRWQQLADPLCDGQAYWTSGLSMLLRLDHQCVSGGFIHWSPLCGTQSNHHVGNATSSKRWYGTRNKAEWTDDLEEENEKEERQFWREESSAVCGLP